MSRCPSAPALPWICCISLPFQRPSVASNALHVPINLSATSQSSVLFPTGLSLVRSIWEYPSRILLGRTTRWLFQASLPVPCLSSSKHSAETQALCSDLSIRTTIPAASAVHRAQTRASEQWHGGPVTTTGGMLENAEGHEG